MTVRTSLSFLPSPSPTPPSILALHCAHGHTVHCGGEQAAVVSANQASVYLALADAGARALRLTHNRDEALTRLLGQLCILLLRLPVLASLTPSRFVDFNTKAQCRPRDTPE